MKNYISPEAEYHEIENADYMAAMLLAECIAAYASPTTLKAYDDSFKDAKPDFLGSTASKTKALGLLIALSENSKVTILNETQEKLLMELKNQVTTLIKNSDLFPIGFKSPRQSTDKALRMPIDVFISGQINWDKSEADYDGMNFTWIRLMQNPEREIPVNKFERSGNIAGENQKLEKINFTALDPSQYVTEKDAAKYLGISQRIIQGLRIKDEGPVITMVGKAIRYKMSDLVLWQNTKK